MGRARLVVLNQSKVQRELFSVFAVGGSGESAPGI